ncbi:MAG: M56 family metallopeptidase [Clostridia bacterium]|nr:M56 family metallopeptidase [Clostridia bacterium]
MRTAVIYNFLIEANLMAAIAILLMIPVRMFGRKKMGSRVMCFAWMLVAIRLLCPLALPNPLIHEIRSSFSNDLAIRPIAGQIQVRFGDAVDALYDNVRMAGKGSALEERLHDLRDDSGNGMLSIRLMKVYLVGVAAVIGWFVLSNWRFQKQLRADRIEQISGKVQTRYEALCAELGVKPIPVYYVDPLPSACLVGCFRPYIALPLTAKPQEVEAVLRHEICHYKGKDHWWCLVRLACCALHWFNPLVWLAARMSRTDSELACDERVIRSMSSEEKRDYASVLVLAAAKRDLPGIAVMSTGMSMTGRRLKKRVVSIISNEKTHRGLAAGFATLAAVALVGAFATAEAPLLGRIPDAEMEYSAMPVIAASTLDLTEEQQTLAIDSAKLFWQSEALHADVNDSLEWTVQAYETHTEVYAFDPNWGEALVLAFSPEGKVLYMNNRRSGDREALIFDDSEGTLGASAIEEVRDYALEVLESLEPGIAKYQAVVEPGSGTRYNQNRFYRFFIYEGEGMDEKMIYVFNVQVYPEVRLTHYENLREFDDEASDRLEPGNG